MMNAKGLGMLMGGLVTWTLLGAASAQGTLGQGTFGSGTLSPLQPVLNPNVLRAVTGPPLLVLPDDGAVTLVWPGDARAAGYDVYQGSQKLTAQPLRSGKAGGPMSFRVKGLKNGQRYDFRVVALGDPKLAAAMSPAPASGGPLVCARYPVQGTDMGAQSQNVRVGGAATVTVNGVNLGLSGGGLYQGTLPAPVAVGAPLNLLTRVGECLVFASDVVPEVPALTAPAAGSSLAASAALPVAWTSASSPQRFVVSATWVTGGAGTGWRSGDLPGATRSFSIPAGTLPAGQTVKVRVYAYNDGTFVGSFTPDSRMAIRGGNEAGRDVTVQAAAPNPPAVSWGDPHLITLDQTALEFQAVGEFDLTQATTDDFRVQARQRPWGGSRVVSVNTAVATRMNGQKVGVYAGMIPALRIGEAGVRTDVPAGGLDLGGGHRVTQSGNVYTLDFPGGERLAITNNGGYLDARLTLPDVRRGWVRGVWGNFDGVTTNDLTARGGAALSSPVTTADLYGVFGQSWRVPNPAESLFVYDTGERFGGFDDPAFPSAPAVVPAGAAAGAEATCRAAGVTDPLLLDRCVTDVALTDNPRFAASSAETQPARDQVRLALPDLTVTAFSAVYSGTCASGAPLVTARVTVRNVGAAASPARSDVGLAQVVDTRDETLSAGYRGNGVGLPALAPGESATVTVPVYYPATQPTSAPGPHTYAARVNFGMYFPEASTANNRFMTTQTVTVPAGDCR
ncbi:VWD domain-containing protein [Deinococcus aquaticus]|uniref:VWD domain-containing protein n=1 Tax=Deinococcus aquaticus TaxID=328692 RepID=A0ABY7UXR4_9DEIO|nr:VWD domain-containing protein [Deinococcus aquaticus]WDA57694.1 VWD domain-containing protein [Deinococcus aquaticus]